MTNDEPTEADLWWKGEDGAGIVRRVWEMVEELFGAAPGVDVSVKLAKPGSPTLTIAFDHEVPDDDDGF